MLLRFTKKAKQSSFFMMRKNICLTVNSLSTNRQLCAFLDSSISCVSSPKQTSRTDYCPQIWKFDLCWPSAPFGSTPQLNCSNSDFNNGTENLVALHCNSTTGTWNKNTEQNDCYAALKQNAVRPASTSVTYDVILNSTSVDYWTDDVNYNNYDSQSDVTKSESTVHVLPSLVTVGYSISLASLIIALILLLIFRRLYCTRVFIHINLMITFIIRGITWLLHIPTFQVRDTVEEGFDDASIFLAMKVFGLYNASNLDQLQAWKKEFCDPFNAPQGYTGCRLYYVINNYAVTASYYWLLIEGIYLSLILRAMNPTDLPKSTMRWFLVLGWVLPWISVIANALAKLFDENENESCWFVDTNQYYWLIIKVPILVSVLINFVIFVLVLRVVGSKLKMRKFTSMENEKENFKWKLTKSTLALIPLLGIHYIVAVFFQFVVSKNTTNLILKTLFELVFTSIQGFLIALLYCFLNSDIQGEVKREWRKIKTNWELDVTNRKKQNNTQATSWLNLYSFSVSKKQNVKTRHGDSACTNGRTSADNSPRRSRFSTVLTETTRLSPFLPKKIIMPQVPVAAKPSLNNVQMKETFLLSGAGDDLLPLKQASTSFMTSPDNKKTEDDCSSSSKNYPLSSSAPLASSQEDQKLLC